MALIDWWNVFFNSLWILGLAIVLAAFSYHDWLARETGRRWREVFKEPSWKLWFAVGMFLTCAGFGLGVAARWWERGLWALFAGSFGWQTVQAILAMTRERPSPPA